MGNITIFATNFYFVSSNRQKKQVKQTDINENKYETVFNCNRHGAHA